MKNGDLHKRLMSICKGATCLAALILVALTLVGPAASGVINVSPGEASIGSSSGGGSVSLGVLAGITQILSGARASDSERRICTQAPSFAGAVASSDVVRLPSGKKAPIVEINGAIRLKEGCELRKLTYSVEDEHARFEGAAEARIADDGSFSIAIPLQGITSGKASRNGSMQYTITLFAEDEAGVGRSDAIDVMVIAGPQIQ